MPHVLIAGQFAGVVALPALAGHDHALLVVDIVDDVLQRLAHHILQFRINGEHHGIAVHRRGIGNLAHNLAARVDFHHALALAVGYVGRKLVFHRFFNAGNADEGVAGITLGGVFFHIALGIDAPHIAHGVRGGAALRVDARRAFLSGHAIQLHGTGLNLRYGFKAHVVGDGHGGGIVVVHARSLPDGEDFDDHVLVLLNDFVVGEGRRGLLALLLDDLLAQHVHNQVLFQQRVEQFFLGRIGEIKVRPPLALARGVYSFRSGIGGKAPHAVLVLLQPEFGDGGFAIRFHQLDGLEDGARIILAVFLRTQRRITIECHIITQAVIGQRGHVDIVNGAAHAGDCQRLCRARAGARGGRVLILDHHVIQLQEYRRKCQYQHQADHENAVFVWPQKDFTSRLADVRW